MLSAVVEQTADSVFVTDCEGVIEYVNPATSRITGFAAGELIGRTPRVLRSGVHDGAFYEKMWATLRRGEVFRGTIVNRRKDGDLYHAEQTVTPIRDAAGVIRRYVSVGKDVTELRRAAEQTTRLLVARSVQQRLYPAAPPRSCGFDIAGSAFLADRTGGDYFDFITLPDGCLAVVIGDVSGHGIDAALVMAETRAYLRSAAQSHSDPGDVLTSVNRVLVADVQENQFVTLLVACLDRTTGQLRYASAGHVVAYVLGANGEIKAQLESTGMPLGIFPEAIVTSAETPPLAAGDVMAFFTDGVSEAEDGDGRPFGDERAVAVIRRCRNESSAKILNHLYRAIRDFTGPVPQTDDITAIICRFDGPHPA
jgi:sigma-B regulation protein RsbU (phosphoserine phosphatase)